MKRYDYFGLWTGDIYIVTLFCLTCLVSTSPLCLPICLEPFLLQLSVLFPFRCHSALFINSVSLSLIVCQGLSHWPPVIFGEVVEDVHFVVVLQQAVGCADVVTLQHRAVIVQDSCVWPVKEKAIVSHWSIRERTAYRDIMGVDWMLLQFNLSVKYVI